MIFILLNSALVGECWVKFRFASFNLSIQFYTFVSYWIHYLDCGHMHVSRDVCVSLRAIYFASEFKFGSAFAIIPLSYICSLDLPMIFQCAIFIIFMIIRLSRTPVRVSRFGAIIPNKCPFFSNIIEPYPYSVQLSESYIKKKTVKAQKYEIQKETHHKFPVLRMWKSKNIDSQCCMQQLV